MLKERFKLIAFICIAAAISIAAACFVKTVTTKNLVLTHRDTGEVFAEYPLKEGDRFSITFIHSVNKTPVSDIFEIEDGDIYVEECLYYGFGAGVQTQLNPGEVLNYTDDGGMLISNIHQKRNNMGYIVGTVSDHILHINDEDISLRNLCGKSTAVRFNYK